MAGRPRYTEFLTPSNLMDAGISRARDTGGGDPMQLTLGAIGKTAKRAKAAPQGGASKDGAPARAAAAPAPQLQKKKAAPEAQQEGRGAEKRKQPQDAAVVDVDEASECAPLTRRQRASGDRPATPAPASRTREEPRSGAAATPSTERAVVGRAGPSEAREAPCRKARVWAPRVRDAGNLSPSDSVLGPGPSMEQALELTKGFVTPRDKEALKKVSVGHLAADYLKALAVMASHGTVLADQGDWATRCVSSLRSKLDDLVHEVEGLKRTLAAERAEKEALKQRVGTGMAEPESVKAEASLLRAKAESAEKQLKTQESEAATKLEEAEAKRLSEVDDLVQNFGREVDAHQRSWKESFLDSAEFLHRVQLFMVPVLTAGLEIGVRQLERHLRGKGIEVSREGFTADVTDQCGVELEQAPEAAPGAPHSPATVPSPDAAPAPDAPPAPDAAPAPDAPQAG
ncbi:hypothetical protein Ancab_039640 [Ancistrocladus abbreviatus]